jgi:ABC-type polysaccharide/polyol phosphate transport system ATPase subunit
MAFIIAENVRVRFPVLRGSGPNSYGHEAPRGLDDSRLIRSASGAITGVQALDGIGLESSKGDRWALIGRNGSGKSTFLQVLAGLLPPDEGVVKMSSRPTNLININLGMELEADGRRNIMLRGLAAGWSKKEILARQAEIEDFSGLGPFLAMPVGTLSAGMRMRLNFAIATAFDPEILLLDEWLSAGDVEFQKKAAERMDRFVSAAGIVVMASHGRRLIERVCNRCLWIEAGKARMIGDPKQVMDAYERAMADEAISVQERTAAQ